MKQIFASLIVMCFVSSSASAQIKAVQTVKISTPTVQCEMCKKKIETYLNRYDGISTINVNFKRKETTVKFISDRINIEEIKAAISTAGYDAAEVPALEDAYNKLPACCKKPTTLPASKKG
ncbi:MAG: cation transporter [Chitinophagaceae bacterium]